MLRHEAGRATAEPEASEMEVPTIFETCRPRPDVLRGAITEADFAADLAQVISGTASDEYRDPVRFFANTHPTRGIRNLLAQVCRRLSGTGGEVASVFRLDTSYGGGKTHGLIALAHAAGGMRGVKDVGEFLEPALVPKEVVRIASFDGENADPANGRAMGEDVFARTPWGEIAYLLAGKAGYERVRESDEQHSAPGAETLRELFGGEPTLILLDEPSVYLRKVRQLDRSNDQFSAFLTALFKAVEGTRNAAVVYTLAMGKGGQATDAYSEENQLIARQMEEAEKISARKATLLNPTEEDETVDVLKRRLFESIEEGQIEAVVDAYHQQWSASQDSLADEATRPETVKMFLQSYPLHPEVLETLTGKTATLNNFQRVRGMLRLLARTVAQLWQEKEKLVDATAIHVHHIDPGHGPIHQEIVTRLGQAPYIPAITNDVSAGKVARPSLAEQIDAEHHQGLPPYAAYVARTVFIHSLAYNEQLKGLSPKQLRYAMACPALELGFIEEARKDFMGQSAYLDDRPGAPMRFLVDANLNQIIRGEERHVPDEEVRAQLNDRIKEIFDGNSFELAFFPGGAYEVPDEVGDNRPKLAVLAYDGLTVGGTVDEVPGLIKGIYTSKGADNKGVRAYRNHLAFVVADEMLKEEMRSKTRRRLALKQLIRPDRISDLAEHQQDVVREMERRSEHELAVSIQQCYRHVFYPSRNKVNEAGPDLGHTAIDVQSASDKPGSGQRQVERALRDLHKLQSKNDEPNSPRYIHDQTPLKKRGELSTLALRDEFRRDPGLPMLFGDDTFIRGIRQGVEEGLFVYRRGDLLFGPEDPAATIRIDEQALVCTMVYAKNKGIWPRPQPKPPIPPPKPPEPTGPGTPPPPKPATTFWAEGVLKAAFTELWEKVRGAKAKTIGVLKIRLFDANDGFNLLGAVGTVAGAESTVSVQGGYETERGASCEMDFQGPVRDAEPVKEFFVPQLRDASATTVDVEFTLTFADGLPLDGGEIEKLTGRLSRFVSGAAKIEAVVKSKS